MLNGIDQNNLGLLEEPKSRWRLFGASFGAQIALLVVVLVASFFQGPSLLTSKDFTFVDLTAPDVARVKPRPPEPVRAAKVRQPVPTVVQPKLLMPSLAHLPKRRTDEIAAAPKVSAPIPEFQQQFQAPI